MFTKVYRYFGTDGFSLLRQTELSRSLEPKLSAGM